MIDRRRFLGIGLGAAGAALSGAENNAGEAYEEEVMVIQEPKDE